MAGVNLQEKFNEALQAVNAVKELIDPKDIDRYINLIRDNDTAGMIETSFSEPDAETGIRFVDPDLTAEDFSIEIDESIEDGELLLVTDTREYMRIPFAYFEDPEKWEAELFATIKEFRTKALTALYKVFPKLEHGYNSTIRITVEPFSEYEKDIFRFGILGSPSWEFKYNDVIYGGRYCINYDTVKDAIFFLPGSMAIGNVRNSAKYLTAPATQEDVDIWMNRKA